MRRIVSSLAFCAIALFQPGAALADPPERAPEYLPFEEIEWGEFSYYRYDDPEFAGAEFHITDQRSWEQFWTAHTSGRFPPGPAPEVRFPRENVIVILLGFQPMGGRLAVGVRSVVRTGHRSVTVRILEDRTEGPLAAITNPYQIIRTPRIDEPIRFIHEEPGGTLCRIHQHCGRDRLCVRADPTCRSPVTGQCRDAGPGTFCPAVYIPVCGCDGMTYGNACELEVEGAVLSRPGECE